MRVLHSILIFKGTFREQVNWNVYNNKEISSSTHSNHFHENRQLSRNNINFKKMVIEITWVFLPNGKQIINYEIVTWNSFLILFKKYFFIPGQWSEVEKLQLFIL